MNLEPLRPYRPILLAAALAGLAGINGPFLYFALVEREVYAEAMSNGMALVFIAEAFVLLVLAAFVIAKLGWTKPGWVFFVAMSLLGSLAFSVPLQLYLMTGRDRGAGG